MNFQDHLNGFSKMRDETRSSSSGNRSHSSRSCGNRPISHAATNKPRADHNIDQKYHDFLNGVKETNKQPTQQRRRARHASGGHVALTKNNAERLAKQGRFGDTKLAKVGTLTAKLMDGLVHGGHKQINPKTGLREYALCPHCGGDIETCSCKDPEFYKQQNINKNNNPVLTQQNVEKKICKKTWCKNIGLDDADNHHPISLPKYGKSFNLPQSGLTCGIQNSAAMNEYVRNLYNKGNRIGDNIITQEGSLSNYLKYIHPLKNENNRVFERIEENNQRNRKEAEEKIMKLLGDQPHKNVKDFAQTALNSPEIYTKNNSTVTDPQTLLATHNILSETREFNSPSKAYNYLEQNTANGRIPVMYSGAITQKGTPEQYDQKGDWVTGPHSVTFTELSKEMTSQELKREKDNLNKLFKIAELSKEMTPQELKREKNNLNKGRKIADEGEDQESYNLLRRLKEIDRQQKYGLLRKGKMYNPALGENIDILADKSGNVYTPDRLNKYSREKTNKWFFSKNPDFPPPYLHVTDERDYSKQYHQPGGSTKIKPTYIRPNRFINKLAREEDIL